MFDSNAFVHNQIPLKNDRLVKRDYRINSYKNARVLVVEDNILNQEVLEGILTIFGITPIFANTGVECIELLNERKFDLIFMDIVMPEMDGFETTSKIRNSQKEYSDIPIVAITGKNENDEVKRCFKVGMNDFLNKPIQIELVSNILRDYLYSFIIEDSKSGDCTSVNELSTHIPGVNITEGIIQFGGKSDTYYRSILSFASDLNLEFLNYDDFVCSENFKENAKFLHTVKGVSGNLSIEEIFRSTILLERNFLNGILDRNCFQEWVETCTQVKQAILAFCSKNLENNKNNKRDGSPKELNAYLIVLHEALVRYSVSACDEILEVLRGTSWGDVQDEFLEYLYKAIEDYEFDLAINLLKEREQHFFVPIEC